MNWSDISVCDLCGGEWNENDNFIVCSRCGQLVDKTAGWVKLDHSPKSATEPFYKGQIGDPSAAYLKVFRTQYAPVIAASGLDQSDLRVLELGAGVGRTSHALIQLYAPRLYVATEPFSSLARVLRNNLNLWGYPFPKGIAASYDANLKPLMSAGSINLIIGNSVLHHILDYESGLAFLIEVLDNPGIMIFGEPIKEGWAYWATIVNMVLQSNQACTLSLQPQSTSILRRHVALLSQRMVRYNDREYLSTIDDKHMFSPLKMMQVADDLGMSLKVIKQTRDVFMLIRIRLERLGVNPKDIAKIVVFCREIVPAGLDDTLISDFVAMFVFSKIAKKST